MREVWEAGLVAAGAFLLWLVSEIAHYGRGKGWW